MVQQVKKEITNAFVKFSEKDNIELENVRIQILKKDSKLNYYLRKKNKEKNSLDNVRATDLKEMIGVINTFVAEKPLFNSVKKLLELNSIDEKESFVILFLDSNNIPMVDLYNKGRRLKQITIDELIN